MTREELSELDRRIAASVARGEAAIARGEALVVKQQEAQVRLEAVIAGMGERAKREEAQLAELIADRREARDERRAMIEALLTVIDRLPPEQGQG